MKKISNVWTVVYKEKDAKLAKLMVDDSDGGEIIDDYGNVDGCIEIEWSYLINGKLIN